MQWNVHAWTMLENVAFLSNIDCYVIDCFAFIPNYFQKVSKLFQKTLTPLQISRGGVRMQPPLHCGFQMFRNSFEIVSK